MNALEINSLVLAYLGDTVYENYVRFYLIEKGINHVQKLQVESLNYVSANSQRRILEELENNNILTKEELDIVKWGRNAKGGKARHADIITYRHATSLETLVGYLYLNNNIERLNEIMNFILK